jgi:hypothetical protein
MSCHIYCLYSTEDGVPRYVGKASDKVSYRFKQHIAAALEMEPGPLYEWIRDVWRRDFDVNVHTLQEGIVPRDLDMFEHYWIKQFEGLLNVVGNVPGTVDSEVAKQLKAGLKRILDSSKTGGVPK